MKTLSIDEKKALKIYPSASAELKQILEDSFGKTFFNQKITDRIKTFEDACAVVCSNTSSISDYDTADEIAYKKLKIIASALNEGWSPNWNDDNECKYYPWFYSNGPSGFRLADVGYYYAYSRAGSRLCFKSRELAEYAAKQFYDIYKSFFTL